MIRIVVALSVLCVVLAFGLLMAVTDPFPTYDPDKYYDAFRRCESEDTHLTDGFCREYARAKSVVAKVDTH